jgi:O-antigen ligase
MSFVGRTLEHFAGWPAAEERARAVFRQLLFVAIILAVWISTRPFNTLSRDAPAPMGGDVVNQLTFSALAALAVCGLFMANRRALLPLLQPSYVLLIAWMIFATLNSTSPATSQRALAFTMIIMFLAASLFVLPQRFRDFENLLLGSIAIILGLSYFGVVGLPDLAIHTDFDPFEPEHAGSWKGHFDHKNIAGAMMSIVAITGIYALRRKRLLLGAALLAGGVAFLYFTKSKTSLALLPMTIACCLIVERIPWLAARLVVCLAPVSALLAITLGSAMFPEIAEINKAVMRDPTFTGRYDIWRYGFEMLAYRPWLGYGFEAFWQTPTTLQGESKLELAWEAEQIVHGHSGYLDVALTQGIVGLAIVVIVFLLKPVADYHRASQRAENRHVATMFLMMWMFISLGMCLEVYYFRRADPVWFALLIAVFGLRFTAVYRIDLSPSPTAPSS